MPKFFVPSHYIFGDYALIKGQEALHIYKVLRLKTGEKIRIFDGNGPEYLCEICETKKDLVKVNILNKFINNTEAPINTTLFQCIPKGNKMDFIVQKATELGITAIVPVISSRVVVKLEDKKRMANRIERWEKIALEACKQSNRSCIPEISEILSLNDSIKTNMALNSQLKIILWEKEEKTAFRDYVINIILV
ncbi:MAG TPA: 16S rRNA (uracil(1498)-N(3))-methyltransferase, partial [Thermoanaerobacterales bacterium]|nr:16S rRNA (uracil(1498)-N(3))-methyltransferase [Thermoanaerobacterales bacterium]